MSGADRWLVDNLEAIARSLDKRMAEDAGEQIAFVLLTAVAGQLPSHVKYVANVSREQGIDLIEDLLRRWRAEVPDPPNTPAPAPQSRPDAIAAALRSVVGEDLRYLLFLPGEEIRADGGVKCEICSNLPPGAAFALVEGAIENPDFLRIAHPEQHRDSTN